MKPSCHDYVLAFDFSLDHHDVALQTPHGDWLISHQAYDNNWPPSWPSSATPRSPSATFTSALPLMIE